MSSTLALTDVDSGSTRRSLLSLVQRSGGSANTHVAAFLGPNVKVTGDVSFSGGLRVDGHVTGDIKANAGNAGTLTIGNGGQVDGDVTVTNLVVYGHIQGNVHVTGLIDVREQAVIQGTVHYNALEMASGGIIHGRLIRQAAAASA